MFFRRSSPVSLLGPLRLTLPVFLRVLTGMLALCSAAVLAQDGNTEVLWLGQAAMRITTPTGKVIMIDPWLTSNPKTPTGYKVLEARLNCAARRLNSKLRWARQPARPGCWWYSPARR